MLTKTLAIALMIIAPLTWGLLVEYLFELRRRKRGRTTAAGREDQQIVE